MKKIKARIIEFYKGLSIKIGISSKILTIFLALFLAIMLMPLIFSIKGCESLAFDESTGVIGDTIGGVTAPFINFLAAILVYLALKAQIEANNKIQKHFEIERKEKSERLIFEEVIKELDLIKNRIENFELEDSDENINKGTHSFLIAMEASLFEVRRKTRNELEYEVFNGIFRDFIFLLNLFNDNVYQELSFIKIVNLRVDNILNLFETENFERINKPYSFSTFKNSYWKLNPEGMFDELVNFFNAVLNIKKKLEIRNEINSYEATLKWLNKIVEDRRKIEYFKSKNGINKDLRNRLLNLGISKDEEGLEDAYASFEEFDLKFNSFIEIFKKNPIYDLTGFNEYMEIV